MLHLKDPTRVDLVPLGILIADIPKINIALIRNTNSTLMVGLSFVLFFITAGSRDGGI